MTRTPAATHSRPRVRGGWDGPAGLEVDQSCLARTQCAGVDVRFEFQGLTRFLVTVDPHTSLHALTDPPIAHAGVKVAVRRFLGNFDEAGFLTEDAAADQALSGVDPREAARRAADPINAIDIPAAGGRGSWAAAGECLAMPPRLSGFCAVMFMAEVLQGLLLLPLNLNRAPLQLSHYPAFLRCPARSARGVPAGGSSAASPDAGGQRAADAHAAGGAQAHFWAGMRQAPLQHRALP